MRELKQAHFNSYRMEQGPGEQVNAVTGQRMIPLAVGMIEPNTQRKFWLTTQDGPMDCTATSGERPVRGGTFKTLTPSSGVDLWNPHFWEDYEGEFN